jgi:hypothetical protein
MLKRLSSLPHPITYLLLSGVGDRDVVETATTFNELANATTELTAAVLVLALVLLILSFIFLLFLMLATVRWPGPRW